MHELWIYAVESAGWALLGFIVGYLVGRAMRDVHHMATAIPTENTDPDPRRGQDRSRVPPGQVVLGVVILLLGGLTVTQGIISHSATRRVADCQATYNNSFADALDARSNATADAQAALDELLKTVSGHLGQPPVPLDQVRAAIDHYLIERARANATRDQHPYPPPPRDLCH
ncbi:hypothetical protein SAMN05421810_10166 [Amycolatopsis arida]|uniref:Uncharacterized protein n=1 Tax=Amycolatopsis arida TaxID=587909 RepID=A0A1I5KBS4_9PSEU|nr:hypothetical protein [Amycolatopsis arida]TDX96962.1 hypothetical protein CLV69_10264 [Amycolatopsis arida]SFO82061.1 hypothetical protein SAMN05421810_10166 [Amycolatopsis arida]